MEPRANYVATGAFVLLVLAGIVAAALWLSGAQLRIPYAVFETHVSGSVNGLDAGAPVRLNGINVGRVSDIHQDPENPKDVILLLQIREDAIIRAELNRDPGDAGTDRGTLCRAIRGNSCRTQVNRQRGSTIPNDRLTAVFCGCFIQ